MMSRCLTRIRYTNLPIDMISQGFKKNTNSMSFTVPEEFGKHQVG